MSRPQRGTMSLVKDLSKRAVTLAGCGLNRCFGSRAGQRFGILMYHRVVDHIPGIPAPTWNITPAAFHAQLKGLLDLGFHAWPLSRALKLHDCNEAFPEKIFVVTFDDAHQSVFTNALPVLRELQIPATVFLATAYLDSKQPFPFDSWSIKRADLLPPAVWQPLTTDQCQEMVASGLVELGAHTHTHHDFSKRPIDFPGDLEANLDLLKSQFGLSNPPFAFPYGRATKEMMHAVREGGASCGLTTKAVPVDPRESPFGWGRFDVEAWDTAESLAAKLGGWYSWAPELRQRITARRRPEILSG